MPKARVDGINLCKELNFRRSIQSILMATTNSLLNKLGYCYRKSILHLEIYNWQCSNLENLRWLTQRRLSNKWSLTG